MRSGLLYHRQNHLPHRRTCDAFGGVHGSDNLLPRNSRFHADPYSARPLQARFDPFDVRIRCRCRRSYPNDRPFRTSSIERCPNSIVRVYRDEPSNIGKGNKSNPDRRIAECRYRYRKLNSDARHRSATDPLLHAFVIEVADHQICRSRHTNEIVFAFADVAHVHRSGMKGEILSFVGIR